MKQKIKILFFFSIISFNRNYAQNLVPNPSFETYTQCPDTSFIGFHAILDSTWYEYNSADYFNNCDTSNFYGVPSNFIGGYQFARSGNAYVGLIAYNSGMLDREYIEIQLSSPLINGQIYYLQYFVSLADTMQYAIENMGALFTDTLFDPYPPPSYSWITGVPQVENASGNMLNDKINWVPISASFIATGGEKFITIGNFKDDAHTISQYFGGTTPGTNAAYYYIDDVYVGNTPPPVGVHEIAKDEMNFRLYPNPSNGNFILEYDLKQNEKGVLNIYDLIGKLVSKYNLANGTKSLAIDAHSLNPGTYVYEIIVNGKPIKKDKLTIIK